jgi:hypothetical protein
LRDHALGDFGGVQKELVMTMLFCQQKQVGDFRFRDTLWLKPDELGRTRGTRDKARHKETNLQFTEYMTFVDEIN